MDARKRLEIKRTFTRSPTLANAQWVLRELKDELLGAIPFRLAMLRSFTMEPMLPLLKAYALLDGIALDVYVGAFNTIAQDVLDEDSALYAFKPDAVVIAAQTRDVAPELWDRFSQSEESVVEQAADRVSQAYSDWVTALRYHGDAQIIVHALEIPAIPCAGVLDASKPIGQVEAIRRVNRELSALAAAAGAYLLDYDGLVSRHGRDNWHDERKWLTARMPIAAEYLPHLAREYRRYLLPLAGRICKAVVVDLDNTLWGGVIGEDGPDGIQLGAEYPGAAYQAVQRVLLDLHARGILLAICSKNNEADAKEVLGKHPGMLLEPEHFCTCRIDWRDKAANLRLIAEELNIGLDALAFVDDNPLEREAVAMGLPEVTVIDLPEDPMGYADVIRRCPYFERLVLSDEDRRRQGYYAQQSRRKDLQREAPSIEDFYRSLDMEIEVVPLRNSTIQRAAQLSQRTNQFNVTTRRYSEQDVSTWLDDPDVLAWTLSARDRFGDSGIVGLAAVRGVSRGAWELDTFLLSCRVIGRTIETGFLSAIVAHAREAGVARLAGIFVPTRKNTPAADLFHAAGFALEQEDDNGVQTWVFNPCEQALVCPDWIECSVSAA